MSFRDTFMREMDRHSRIKKGLPAKQLTEGLGSETCVSSCGATDCMNYDPNAMSNCVRDKIVIGAGGHCQNYITPEMSGSTEGTKAQIGGIDRTPAKRNK